MPTRLYGPPASLPTVRKRKATKLLVTTTVNGEVALESRVTMSPRVVATKNDPALQRAVHQHWLVVNQAREQGQPYLLTTQVLASAEIEVVASGGGG